MRPLAGLLGFSSALTLVLTVAVLPWMLGGVIPAARLLLLIGAIVAALLSLLAQLFSGKPGDSITAVAVPLLGLVVLGTFQLRPAAQYPSAGMQHAVADTLPAGTDDYRYSQSVIPAETRSSIAMALALTLIATAAFQQLRTQRWMTAASVVMVANGIIITVIGMSQVFGQRNLSLNSLWSLDGGKRTAFAGFVNVNSAAGWLCLIVALASGWITWYLKPSGTSPKLRRGRLRVSVGGRIWQRVVEFMADLTVWQTLLFAGVAFLAAGVASTQSRGGVLALLTGVFLTLMARSSVRRLPGAIVLMVLMASLTYGLLHWLELDAGLIREMKTLQDLEAAAATRLTHWADTLVLFLDFPLFGTGLGSYRFATLPYQAHYSDVWYRHADNQYIDMLVEGGLTGLLLFAAIGVAGIAVGLAAWKQSRVRSISRKGDTPRISRRFMAGIGTAVVMAALTQAFAAFFDFGIGMPPAAALLVLMTAAVSGFLAANSVNAGLATTSTIRVGRAGAILLQVSVLLAACIHLPDQFAATQIDRTIVDGYRLLAGPINTGHMNQLSSVRSQLDKDLQQRPDDPEGLRLACRLALTEFRWQSLRNALGDQPNENQDLETLWNAFTVQGIIRRVKSLEDADKPFAEQARIQLARILDRTDAPLLLEAVQNLLPLMPKIALERAAVSILLNDIDEFERQVQQATAVEPGHAAVSFRLGLLALSCDRQELAEDLWHRSLRLSEDFRAAMLEAGATEWEQDELIELFGPQDYLTCATAATNTDNLELRKRLWQRADNFWQELTSPSEHQAIVRTKQLSKTGRKEEALEWIAEAVDRFPDNIALRRLYAQLLEEFRQYKKALEEWNRIEFFVPGDAEAGTAISRIWNLKEAE